LYQIVADWYTVTTSGDAHFLVVCRHCYVLKGYVLKGYVLKGYVLKGYVLKGYVLKGYVLKGYVLKGYVLFLPIKFSNLLNSDNRLRYMLVLTWYTPE